MATNMTPAFISQALSATPITLLMVVLVLAALPLLLRISLTGRRETREAEEEKTEKKHLWANKDLSRVPTLPPIRRRHPK